MAKTAPRYARCACQLHHPSSCTRLLFLGLQARIQELDGNVDVVGLTGDGDETFFGIGSLTRLGRRARFSDSDLTLGLSADFVDLGTAFADDYKDDASASASLNETDIVPSGRQRYCAEILTGADQGVGNEDLLGLSARSEGVGGWSGGVYSGSASGAGLAIRASGGAGISFLVFEEDGTDVVDGNVDGVGDTRDGQDSLVHRELDCTELGNKQLTSVDPGSMASLAFKRAPLASWISLILDPPLPMLR